MRRHGMSVLARAQTAIGSSAIAVDTELLERNHPRVSEMIVLHAKAWGAEAIVLGTHGRRGMNRIMMGSDAEQVVRMAPVPVLLVRLRPHQAEAHEEGERDTYRKILVAVDGSRVARSAFTTALRIAKAAGAELHAICVVEQPAGHYPEAFFDVAALRDGLTKEAHSALAGAETQMLSAGIPWKTQMVDGAVDKAVAEQIQSYAEEVDADLVVMGTHGRRGFRRMVLGSVAETFLRLSTHPVLLIPHREETTTAT
jgi:nucleotide-binding universal stress UspA family protein